MIYELNNPRQNENEPRRRIFQDEYFDLYVWFDEHDEISGFQLCYDKFNNQRALTWTRETGYYHNKVDDGEEGIMRYKMKPILIADGIFDFQEISRRFIAESASIDTAISKFVYNKLLSFGDSMP